MEALAAPLAMLFSEACERNKEPILAMLRRWLPTPVRVLEVGSGSGQHATHFCRQLPDLHWQTTDRAEYLPDLRERLAVSRTIATRDGNDRDANASRPVALEPLATGSELPEPLELDVDRPEQWPQRRYGAVFSANTTHIMAAESVPRLLAGAAGVLEEGGLLLLYGPFLRRGQPTAPSNGAFDAHLRSLDPAMGLREAETLIAAAAAQGLVLQAIEPMPSHNLMLIAQRQ
jgi:hypothetical protein